MRETYPSSTDPPLAPPRKGGGSVTASIADLSLSECLQIVGRHFNIEAITGREIDAEAVLDYYRQSDRGYRLFHSKQGAMHVAMNCTNEFSTEGYLGQVNLVAERLIQAGARQVLEIGCGTGYNLRNLAKRMPASHFTGIDLSEAHVKSAEKEADGLENVRFEQADFHRLPFEAESFCAVFAVECLCQGTDWQSAIGEVHRVLKSGGSFFVIDCFRQSSLGHYNSQLQLAARLIEKTMAVEEFAVLDDWLRVADHCGFALNEQTNLSDSISHNLARFYSLARRYFKMPLAARAFLKAFPPRLIENAISGLLMPFTVGSGLHQYCFVRLQKRDQK